MTMLCPKCNFKNTEDSQYCTQCGTKLSAWYYIDGENVCGPCNENTMWAMFQGAVITKNTFVWNECLEDWTLFRNSPLMFLKNFS